MRESVERIAASSKEAGTEQKVFGGVPGQGEFGEYHNVGAKGSRPCNRIETTDEVAVEVADRGIDLGQCCA